MNDGVAVDPLVVPQVQAVLDAYVDRAVVVLVVHNGRVFSVDESSMKGLHIEPVAYYRGGDTLLGSASPIATDVFAEMNNAFAAEPLAVVVEANAEIDAPIVIVHWNDGDGAASPAPVVRPAPTAVP